MKKILLLRTCLVAVCVLVWTSACSAAESTDAERAVPMPARLLTSEFRSIFAAKDEHLRKKEFSEAAAECRKIIENYPDDRDVLLMANFGLGYARSERKDYAGAAEAYKKALANFPADDDSYRLYLGNVRINLASAYIKLGKHDDALQILKQQIQQYPERVIRTHWAAEAVHMLRKCFPDEKDRKEYQELLEELRAEHGGDDLAPDILYEMGRCHARSDRDMAVQTYQELVDKFPDHDLADKARDRIKFYTDPIQFFEDLWAEQQAKGSGSLTTLVQIARYHALEKDYERAIKKLRQLIDTFPDDDWAKGL